MFLGIVDSYDEPRGVGIITGYEPGGGRGSGDGEPGGRKSGGIVFHCTAISDGTRTVAPGTAVAYSLVPGHFGVMEPYPVVKIDQRQA